MTIQQTSEGQPSTSSRLLFFFNWCWIFWVGCQLYFAGVALPFSVDELKLFHLGFALPLLALTMFCKEAQRTRWIWLFVCLSALATTLYLFFGYDEMIERVGEPSTYDCIFGGVFVVCVLFITWRQWGLTVPLIVLGALVYALLGNHFDGLFHHAGIDPERLIGYSSIYYMGTLGSLTGMSASMIFQFIIFGALLQGVGGYSLIEKISALVCRRFASGAPQTAIYSSAFIGMMTGSAAANVAITGSFTIPMMKSRGFTPEYAGAVEAVASTGGQILPPVMGVAAFIMAALIGVPYFQICIAALLPAAVYFLHLSFSAMIQTAKIGLRQQERNESTLDFASSIKQIMREHGHLFLPILFLTWSIFKGDSPAKAAVNSNLLLVAVSFLHVILFRTESLATAVVGFGKNLGNSLLSGGREGAKIAIILGALGIIVEIFTTTGFGQRLSQSMIELSGGNLFILIALTMVLTIFFGMGMPTPGAYLLTVLLSAPVLIKAGFPLLSVHMFVFYFAVIAAITPPVATASLVAVSISGGDYIKTSLKAVRLGLQGVLLPIFFLIRPEILSLETNPLAALEINFMLFVCGLGFTILLEGFFLHKVCWAGKAICLTASIFILYPNDLLSWLGVCLLGVYMYRHCVQNRKRTPETCTT